MPRDPPALAVRLAGLTLLLAGVAGYVLTPRGALFALFGVNPLHHALHALAGTALLLASARARQALQAIGALYAVLAVVGALAPALTHAALGIAAGGASIHADNLLHAAIAAMLLAAGNAGENEPKTSASRV